MNLKSKTADIFVPDATPIDEALLRTTDLCIAAHQDDAEILAFSAIADCYGQKDKWFSCVIVTNGAGSPRTGIYKNFSDEEMQKIRKVEQRKAAIIGEYSALIQLGYSSAEVKNPEFSDISADLFEILVNTKPQNVYLHNPADKHDTHVATFLRSLKALRSMPPDKRPLRVYGCEVWRSLDWLCDDEKVTLDASQRKNLASALLGVFDSQISGGKRYDLAVEGRRLANATFFASHTADQSDALIFSIDITPLVKNPELSVSDFISAKIERFKNDVIEKIRRFE